MIKKRIPLPTQLKRALLVECGNRCTIFGCYQMRDLEAHHINSRPDDNRKENLIMLCPNHHAMADKGEIDRKACLMYKKKRESSEFSAEQILEIVRDTTKETLQSELKKIINRDKNILTRPNNSTEANKNE